MIYREHCYEKENKLLLSIKSEETDGLHLSTLFKRWYRVPEENK